MTLSPRHKLIGAALLALIAPLIAAAQGASAATAARVLLGLAAAGGLAFWFIRARGGLGTSKFKTAPRLNVVQRVGLSQRTGARADRGRWQAVPGRPRRRLREDQPGAPPAPAWPPAVPPRPSPACPKERRHEPAAVPPPRRQERRASPRRLRQQPGADDGAARGDVDRPLRDHDAHELLEDRGGALDRALGAGHAAGAAHHGAHGAGRGALGHGDGADVREDVDAGPARAGPRVPTRWRCSRRRARCCSRSRTSW